MIQEVTVKTGFKKLSDSEALAIAGAVLKGVYADKAISAAPPFDQTTLQTAVDDLTGAIAVQAQAGGGTAVTAVKNKKRNALDGLLRKLAHYVQANCNEVQAAAVGANNTVGLFQTAGVFTKSRSMAITGLTPGTIYAIQVRALGGSTGSGDWSDSVTHMCM